MRLLDTGVLMAADTVLRSVGVPLRPAPLGGPLPDLHPWRLRR